MRSWKTLPLPPPLSASCLKPKTHRQHSRRPHKQSPRIPRRPQIPRTPPRDGRWRIAVTFPDGWDGDPEIRIAPEVLDDLASVWKWTVVTKLLGQPINFQTMERKLRELWHFSPRMQLLDVSHGCILARFGSEQEFNEALTKGPWTVFGHCLAVRAWTATFHPSAPIDTTPTWVRIHDLPIQYYEERVLSIRASGICRPLKVDPKTLHSNRGRFARLCVEVDLNKPLRGTVLVNGNRFLLKYEGLPEICYECGRYGHRKEGCPYRPSPEAQPLEKAKEAEPGANLKEISRPSRALPKPQPQPQQPRTLEPTYRSMADIRAQVCAKEKAKEVVVDPETQRKETPPPGPPKEIEGPTQDHASPSTIAEGDMEVDDEGAEEEVEDNWILEEDYNPIEGKFWHRVSYANQPDTEMDHHECEANHAHS
ncbi:hypothetical protein V2J09_000011 [Rumex salicifolius]